MGAWFYILRLKSGQLYIGATKDLQERYKNHTIGRACHTTRNDPPIDLLYSETYDSLSEARKRQAQVKRWKRAKKEALAARDYEALKKA